MPASHPVAYSSRLATATAAAATARLRRSGLRRSALVGEEERGGRHERDAERRVGLHQPQERAARGARWLQQPGGEDGEAKRERR